MTLFSQSLFKMKVRIEIFHFTRESESEFKFKKRSTITIHEILCFVVLLGEGITVWFKIGDCGLLLESIHETDLSASMLCNRYNGIPSSRGRIVLCSFQHRDQYLLLKDKNLKTRTVPKIQWASHHIHISKARTLHNLPSSNATELRFNLRIKQDSKQIHTLSSFPVVVCWVSLALTPGWYIFSDG